MERQPNNENEPKRYSVEYNGKKYILGPENTVLYLHADCPEADHFYVQFEDDAEGEQVGHYGWRRHYREEGVEAQFNDMIINLVQVGCQQVLKSTPSHFDLEQYLSRFGELPQSHTEAPQQAFEEPEPQTLTPRQENLVRYLSYLLLNGHITAEEFNNASGDIYI